MSSESDNAVQITSNCTMSFSVSYLIDGIMCAVSGAAHLGQPAVVPRAKGRQSGAKPVPMVVGLILIRDQRTSTNDAE